MHEITKRDIIMAFIIGIGFGISLYLLCFLPKTQIKHFFDFEKQEYAPYTYNGQLFLINKKNGKTYKLIKIESEKAEAYIFKLIAQPKKEILFYNPQDPLSIFGEETKKQIENEIDKRSLSF